MQLNFKQLGQGQPLIILHGLLGSADNWLTISKAFAEKYTVFLVNQRNHGRSPWDDTHTYEALSNDLHEFIESHNLQNPVLLGHSMGGKTVMFYATRYQNFEKIIVVDIAPKPYMVDYSDYFTGMMGMNLAATENRQQAEEFLTPYAPDFGVRQFLLKNLYRDEKGHFAWRPNLEILSSQTKNIGQMLPENAFSDKPALFIRGERSDYILDSDWLDIIEHFPNSRLETVAGAGHWVQAEQPAGFLEKVLPFLEILGN
jgi:pimeloyl-ACP methyl ester carboxylesterase